MAKGGLLSEADDGLSSPRHSRSRPCGIRPSQLVDLVGWKQLVLPEQRVVVTSVAAQCFGLTQAEQWAVNKGVHYDSWYASEAADLKEVVDAFRDLCDVFQCPNCGGLLSLSMAGLRADAVRCPCTHVNWNLVKKSSP